tara:strand:+ start:901 stop:1155 length:255 start_codon:yes stop_codon:yes gene_type:complete
MEDQDFFKLKEENNKYSDEIYILNNKIKSLNKKIESNNKKIQQLCYHNFEKYIEYGESTTYECHKCRLCVDHSKVRNYKNSTIN